MGVHLGFDAHLLDFEVFCASLPMCCVQCENDDQDALVAHPIVWTDKAFQRVNAAELTNAHKMHLENRPTRFDVVKGMPPFEDFPVPFNKPIPYYTCEGCSTKVNILTKVIQDDKHTYCDVLIPSVRYAIKWLANVNGICDPEYLRLEAEDEKFEEDQWLGLEPEIRQRLGVWFKFGPNEHFRGYYCDSDFPKRDQGLGGIILTNERLVWCKYHNHGELSLSKEGEIVAIERGIFDELIYSNDVTERKLCSLRNTDVERLITDLEELDSTIGIYRIVDESKPAPAEDEAAQS
ncbi:MAG: hypothetical protein ACYTGQ_05825 [Planctomycetota bacterium]|jgi:hypothetical protein